MGGRSETYSVTAFILLLFSLHPIQFISLENPRSWSRFLHLPFFFFPGFSWRLSIFPMLFSKGWHLVLGGWVVVQKTLCDTLSLMQAKNSSGTLLQYSFKIFFHLPISQTCWKFSILLLFLYSPQSHRQQSLLPWDQRRETWVQQLRLYNTTIPGKWINSESTKWTIIVLSASEVNVKARKQFL